TCERESFVWPHVPACGLPLVIAAPAPQVGRALTPSLLGGRSDPLFPYPRPQHLGYHHGAVGLLIILQDGEDRSRHGHRRAVERVNQARTFLPGGLGADIELPRLVVGAVRGAGHLAVFPLLAAPRHPRLQVVLAVRRPSQVPGAGVDDVIGKAETLEYLLLDA